MRIHIGRGNKKYAVTGTRGPNHVPFYYEGHGWSAQPVFKQAMRKIKDFHFESLRAERI